MATVKRLKNYDDKLIQYEPKPHPGPPTSNNEDTSWGTNGWEPKSSDPAHKRQAKAKGPVGRRPRTIGGHWGQMSIKDGHQHPDSETNSKHGEPKWQTKQRWVKACTPTETKGRQRPKGAKAATKSARRKVAKAQKRKQSQRQRNHAGRQIKGSKHEADTSRKRNSSMQTTQRGLEHLINEALKSSKGHLIHSKEAAVRLKLKRKRLEYLVRLILLESPWA